MHDFGLLLNRASILIIWSTAMEEWDPVSNDFVFRCNSCWRTNAQTKKIIRTSREKYYCLDCLAMFDLCQG
jgi:predicted SprT family Zn-dependent metalloprotease